MRRHNCAFHSQDTQKHEFFYQKNKRTNRKRPQDDTDVGIAEKEFKSNIMSVSKDLKEKTQLRKINRESLQKKKKGKYKHEF